MTGAKQRQHSGVLRHVHAKASVRINQENGNPIMEVGMTGVGVHNRAHKPPEEIEKALRWANDLALTDRHLFDEETGEVRGPRGLEETIGQTMNKRIEVLHIEKPPEAPEDFIEDLPFIAVDVEIFADRFPGIAKAVIEGIRNEVSIQFWAMPVFQSGVFNGEEFDEIETDILITELSLLAEDQQGACTGPMCGVKSQVNEAPDDIPKAGVDMDPKDEKPDKGDNEKSGDEPCGDCGDGMANLKETNEGLQKEIDQLKVKANADTTDKSNLEAQVTTLQAHVDKLDKLEEQRETADLNDMRQALVDGTELSVDQVKGWDKSQIEAAMQTADKVSAPGTPQFGADADESKTSWRPNSQLPMQGPGKHLGNGKWSGVQPPGADV